MGLFENKIKQFPQILEWAEGQDVTQLRRFLLDDAGCNRLFVASGGSYSAAVYAEQLSAGKGIMSHALTPLLYAGSGFADIAAKTLLISASGCNNDILRAYDNARHADKQEAAAATLTPKGRLQTLMQEQEPDGLFCFDIPTGRDGFLSSASVLAFYALLYRAFGYAGLGSVSVDMMDGELEEIDGFVNHLKRISLDELTEHEAFLHKLEGGGQLLHPLFCQELSRGTRHRVKVLRRGCGQHSACRLPQFCPRALQLVHAASRTDGLDMSADA